MGGEAPSESMDSPSSDGSPEEAGGSSSNDLLSFDSSLSQSESSLDGRMNTSSSESGNCWTLVFWRVCPRVAGSSAPWKSGQVGTQIKGSRLLSCRSLQWSNR